MLDPYKDWRFAVMYASAGIVVPAVLHLLPEPLHLPFNWGFSVGWVTLALIMWILERRGNRN